VADDDLMGLLAEVIAAADPMPPHLVDAGMAAFTWRRVDEELAELLFDSADAATPAGMRTGRPPSRQLSYASADLQIECELSPSGLVGQLIPAGSGALEVVTPDGNPLPITVDEHGRFHTAPLPSGPIRLRCRRPSRVEVVTPWLLA
jgi:hypothetical protein